MSDISSIGGTTPLDTNTTTTAKATTTSSKDFKETLAKVSGHKYAKITNGSRKGEYVNQSGNDRNGEAFRLVERDGHEYHVYGKTVVRVADPAPASKK